MATQCAPAIAQPYPSRPIEVVVPVAAGGGTDTLARTLGAKVQEALKQPLLVVNRTGAGGNIGTMAVVRARPDGYTLLFTPATIATNVASYRQLPYDLLKDLQPVTMALQTRVVLVVHAALKAGSVREFVELARARPGELNFGTAGNGSPQQLQAELFAQKLGFKATAVHYKGQSQAMTDLAGGQLQFMLSPLQNALPFIQQGRIRALAVASAGRHRSLPDVPSLAEAGYNDMEMANWFALFAPAGTPAAVVKRLNAEFIKAGSALKAKLEDQGFDALYSTPEEAHDLMRSELARWARVAAYAGIKAE
jgi:tripartite-type tricarboxylate transporter receptor subunit TctC